MEDQTLLNTGGCIMCSDAMFLDMVRRELSGTPTDTGFGYSDYGKSGKFGKSG